MTWIVVILGYLLGSFPMAYIAGRLLRGKDIRRIGDGNMGAANVFRELSGRVGIAIGLLDAAKGALAVLLALGFHASQPVILLTGAAAVVGHNWPVFLGFRGGRGMSTTIGVLFVIVPLPMLIMTVPTILTLIFSRNVIVASAVLFVALPFLGWQLGLSGALVLYSIALPCLVGFTHFLRTRRAVVRQA